METEKIMKAGKGPHRLNVKTVMVAYPAVNRITMLNKVGVKRTGAFWIQRQAGPD